ncbi:WD40 repeat domain-containing protein [Streptomyces olivaceus]|uniref:hypothetical protein n=1 Tax=Streptomyces olivaceus TaxID=47716 RepID=UPI00363E14BC
MWDPATDQVTQFPTGHPNIVTMCAAAHGDDTFIATGGWDAEVRIWEPLTGELRHTLSGHTGFVFALCVPIFGTRPLFATAGQDHTVRIWNPDVGTCLLVIPVHHLAQGITAAGARILIGLGKGMVCLELNPDLLAR